MKYYKLRAECLADVLKFIQLCEGRIFEYKIETLDGGPDVEMLFTTDQKVEDMHLILLLGDDMHVMAQTIMPLNEYTGERTYQN